MEGWLGLIVFLDSPSHAAALHMADVRDSFADILPVLHVLPDVSVSKGSVLICSERRIPCPPIRSLLCCVAAVAGRRQVSASSCIIKQKNSLNSFCLFRPPVQKVDHFHEQLSIDQRDVSAKAS